MKKLLVVAMMFGLSGAALASGGESNNTNCNGTGNANSACTGTTSGTVGTTTTNQYGVATATASATGGAANVTVNAVEPGASVIAPGTTALLSDVTTGSLVSSSTSVSNTNTYEAAASTAYAPALTSGMDTCMGSSSVGGSGVGFGFSVGTTWNDENCVRLKNAREMAAMGYKNIAVAMMCQDAKVREAAESIGSPVCAAAAKKADGTKKQDVATGPDMSDPYIAMRLK